MNMLMEFQGTRSVVLGLGTTGLSLVRHLVRHGAEVRVADTRTDSPNRGVLASEFRGGTYLESGDAWFWFDGATVRQAFARLFEATSGTD
jgi:UDP-N-acetylmuramoylalanine-D-glutamate ligase